jgi:2'-5' RNA ligase
MDASFYADGQNGGTATVPATPRRPPSFVTAAAKDLPAFQVVPPSHRLSMEDLKLPDGSPMAGPDGFLVPPARSFQMVLNSATRVMSYRFDEAMRDNFVNARAMRRDAFLRGLLEERILPTINRRWQITSPDDRDPNQKTVRDLVTRVLEATPDFDALRRALLDGIWFGRAGAQWNLGRNPDVDDYWAIHKWDPIHGDSIQFTFDGVPAILMDGQTAGWYSAHGAYWGPGGDLRPTDRGGTALALQRPFWRDRFAVHVHMREKADYFEGELAGSVQGLGLRGLVYWHYVIRTEALTWMLNYMQAVGQMDLLVFNYPAGDDAAKLNAEAIARKVIGKAAIAAPRNPQQDWPAVEQIPMNDAGLKALHDLIADYFDRHIERLVVGQSMSSGADNESGLGGTGRAEFARATKDEILVYDTNRLDATITRDIVRPLQRANAPWAKFTLQYKSVLPDLEAKDKIDSGQKLISVGIPIKVDELREAANFSRPEPGDETIGGPQTVGMGGPPGSSPNSPMHTAAPGDAPGTPQPQPGEGPAATYPRTAPTPPESPPAGMQVGMPRPALPPHTAPQGGMPPLRHDAGAGMGGAGPAAGPAAGTSPNMGYPGGGNTYTPAFGRKRRPDVPVGFTRFDTLGSPFRYVTDAVGHEHKGTGPGGGQFTGPGGGGSSGGAPQSSGGQTRERVIAKAQKSMKEFRRQLKREFPIAVDLYHEAPYAALDSIIKNGLTSGESVEDTNFATIGQPSNFVTTPDKLIVKFNIRSRPDQLDRIRPDMRYTSDDPAEDLMGEHGGVMGADVAVNGRILPGEIESIAVVRNGTPVGVLTYPFNKMSPVNPTETPPAPVRNQRDQTPVLYAKFGCLMAPLHGAAQMAVLRAGANIADADLAGDGREDNTHVTVRYGFPADVTAADVARVLGDTEPVAMRLGKIGFFAGDDADVVFVEIESPDLRKLHAKLAKLPHTDTHDEYRPHATVAYVKPGLGRVYADQIPAVDLDWVVDGLEYKTPNEPAAA